MDSRTSHHNSASREEAASLGPLNPAEENDSGPDPYSSEDGDGNGNTMAGEEREDDSGPPTAAQLEAGTRDGGAQQADGSRQLKTLKALLQPLCDHMDATLGGFVASVFIGLAIAGVFKPEAGKAATCVSAIDRGITAIRATL